ncbi:DNA polymerase III subunit gamma and tau [Microbacterium limosum]|uniref:DNA polymerase III subunit gamma/tau n=1 Tax=Microbacterium limosum TaxID=3079935 RepID=A0AAU0MIZ6_9MICO|nr:DNA polymerase III subunit gamma and tau [Microbacterium sp. Y20]WOQ70228.1 DNA polymerase III subunit gamma and tau [Microbacterium sp. Y20]
MTAALYRRYRPETFGQMIGQSQVTEPLMTALRNDRVGHAYLFSGPRGCGKTTSARILARCLNCAQGPTDTPCGTCPSCVELSRAGGGSLDVVEIDAASHNGVDDARDLRERAIFAPARDRFKIFILDEAHMVTQQGFNALLKLVEEPPDHVKFIFATTEPEKVLGTIRSRTHHYPFRLVPPGPMLEYVQQLCGEEGVQVESGVLPLVVRAGGGSPRDTLSLLDQLIAGSDQGRVVYERAVALLGYTHTELLDEVVDALSAGDAAAAFGAVDRVVQTGQDPRRFVDDLLERLRDLIVVEATGAGASAVLRGIPADELDRMGRQATNFGGTRLSRVADLVSATLDDMSGATSPRLHLELMIARVLAADAAAGAAPASPAPAEPRADTVRGSAPAKPSARPVAEPPVVRPVPSHSVRPEAPAAREPAPVEPASGEPASTEPAPADPPANAALPENVGPATPPAPVTHARVRDSWPEILGVLETISRSSWLIASNARVVAYDDEVLTLAFQSQGDVAKFRELKAGSGASEDLRQAIDRVLGVRVKFLARGEGPSSPPPPADDSPPDDEPPYDEEPPRDRPSGERAPRQAPPAAPPPRASRPPQGSAAPAAPVTEWAVATIPAGEGPAPDPSAGYAPFPVDDDPEEAVAAAAFVATIPAVREGEVLADDDAAPVDDDPVDDVDTLGPAGAGGSAPVVAAPTQAPTAAMRAVAPDARPHRPASALRSDGIDRYGEAVVRQILGARFVREERYEPPARFS